MTPVLSAQRVASLTDGFPRSPAYLGLAESLRVLIGDGRIGHRRTPAERARAHRRARRLAHDGDAGLRGAAGVRATPRRGAGRARSPPSPGGHRRAHDRSLLPGTGGEDMIDLNCAAHSAPPGLVEAYQRATAELPAYLSGPGYFPLGVPALQARIAASYDARGAARRCRSRSWSPPARWPRRRSSRRPSPPRATAWSSSRRPTPTPPRPCATRAPAWCRPPVDPEGWDLDALAATLRQSSPRLAYLIPDFQNPTGHLMSTSQREELAAALAPHPHGRGRRRGAPGARADARAGRGDAAPARGVRRRRDHDRQREQVLLGRAAAGLGARAAGRRWTALLHARIGLDLGAPVFEQLVLADLMDHADEVLPVHRERLRGRSRRAGRGGARAPAAVALPGARGRAGAVVRAARARSAPPRRPRPSAAAWSWRRGRSSPSRAGSTATSGSRGPRRRRRSPRPYDASPPRGSTSATPTDDAARPATRSAAGRVMVA